MKSRINDTSHHYDLYQRDHAIKRISNARHYRTTGDKSANIVFHTDLRRYRSPRLAHRCTLTNRLLLPQISVLRPSNLSQKTHRKQSIPTWRLFLPTAIHPPSPSTVLCVWPAARLVAREPAPNYCL